MTKKQYLDKLRNNLRFRLADSEIEEILSDMGECFEAGVSEGKSEEEICIGLGTPRDAAASLLSEQEKGTAGFIARLAEYWLPVFISIAAVVMFLYLALDMDIVMSQRVNIVFYFVPLIIWLLLERMDFFRSIVKYKADFFTFAGSVFIFGAGVICGDFLKTILGVSDTYRSPAHEIAITVLVFLSLLMLVLSVWKHAPKPFSAVAAVLAIPVMFRAVQSCRFFSSVLQADVSVVGSYTTYCFEAILGSAVLILIWTLICRNSLTLPTLYLSVMITGYIFYVWRLLLTLDPIYDYSAAELRKIMNGQNYFISGIFSSAAALVMVVIVKFISRRKVGK